MEITLLLEVIEFCIFNNLFLFFYIIKIINLFIYKWGLGIGDWGYNKLIQ